MIRVGVVGAGGRMGREVCARGASPIPRWTWWPPSIRRPPATPSKGSPCVDELTALLEADAEVAVDFTPRTS